MTIGEILADESKNVEFKVQRPKDSIKYMKTVIAFSNGEGGRIVFGVDDDTREVVGIPKENVFSEIDAITTAISDSCEPVVIPDVYLQTIEDKTIIIAEISPGKQRPYYIKSMGIKDGTYIRVSGTSRPAGRDLTAEMYYEDEGRSYDKVIRRDLTVTDEEIAELCRQMKEVAIANGKSKTQEEAVKDITKNVLLSWGLLAEAEDGSFSIDEEKVKEYVAGLAKKYDTVNSKRTFTTTAGNTVTLTPGDYGWEIDQSGTESNLMQAINDGTQGDFEIVYTSTALSRNENDIGNSYVELSLSDQHFWVYVDGKQVMDSEVVTGCRNKGTETPKGVYKVKGKTTDYTMRGEKNASGNWSYQVHCNYWIPFAAEDTIGFHDLTTRSDWSSTAYLDNGSHGCVNTPLDKVKELYDIVSYILQYLIPIAILSFS